MPGQVSRQSLKTRLPIVILTGPNGVGKGTISNKLIADASLNLERFVRHTTRSQGPDEVNSADYHFVRQSEFDEMDKRGEFLHTIRKPFGSYGESKQKVEETLSRGNIPVFELAYDSAEGLTAALNAEGIPTTTIFVTPKEIVTADDLEPSVEILRNRMNNRGRGESPSEMEHRLNSSRNWLASPPRDAHMVINGDGEVESAVDQIREIISRLNPFKGELTTS